MATFLITLLGIIPETKMTHHPKNSDISTGLVVALIFGAFYFIVINPLVEEWYWWVFVYEMFNFQGKKSELNKWIVSLCYASYHIFTLSLTSGTEIALVGTVITAVFGRALIYQRDWYGFFCSYMCHLGCCLGIVVVVLLKFLREHSEHSPMWDVEIKLVKTDF